MKEMFVNNKWQHTSGVGFSSKSPNDGQVVFEGHFATKADCDKAVKSAKEAQQGWQNLGLEKRIEYVRKFVEIVKENKDELSRTISVEVGKPKWEADGEINSIINKLDPCIDAYKARCSDIVIERNGARGITRFLPIGVMCVIGPYNYPMHMTNGQIMAGLIAGNTIVLKPSDKAPLCANKIMECWEKAGLPSGVINMVQGGAKTVEYLVKNKDVNGVYFTGSFKVGQIIKNMCNPQQMCALEMGGDAPVVAWDCDDITSAAITILQGAFGTAGQKCVSTRRLIVPDNKFGKTLIKEVVRLSKKIVVGKFDDEQTPFMGPLRTPQMVENALKLQSYLVSKGAKVLLEAKKMPQNDCFITPCIVDVTGTAYSLKDEVFAPFLRVLRVKTFEEAIVEANSTEYGLATSIITKDEALYKEYLQKAKFGLINWNKPTVGSSAWAAFGGIKNSGNFRPSGYLSSDFCSYAVASAESESLSNLPLPKGMK